MKQQSLRQLAKELGVSHFYLSQVRHGKRPTSDKVVSKVVSRIILTLILRITTIIVAGSVAQG